MTKTTKKHTTKPRKVKRVMPAVPPGPGEITIRKQDNGVEIAVNIKAEPAGEFFALHAPDKGKGVKLTHIGTGLSVGHYRTRAIAVFVALELRKLGGADVWKFTDPHHLANKQPALLAKMRDIVNPVRAEEDMRKAQDPGGARIAAKATTNKWRTKPVTPDVHGDHGQPKYSAPWRSGVDWVAAGRKAYETRLRNLAAQQAQQAPQAPAPKAPQQPRPKAPKAPAPLKIRGSIPRRDPVVTH